MIRRVVRLPDKVVSLAAYVRAWKMVKANPDAQFKNELLGWGFYDWGRVIRQQFIAGMMDRINRGVPRSAPWPGSGAR